MSVKLCSADRAEHIHTFSDDAESVFWVLVYMALRFMGHSIPSVPWVIESTFNLALRPDATAEAEGGDKKFIYLTTGLLKGRDFALENNAPYDELLEVLREELCKRYLRKRAERKAPPYVVDIPALLIKFKAILDREDWPMAEQEQALKVDALPETARTVIDTMGPGDEPSHELDTVVRLHGDKVLKRSHLESIGGFAPDCLDSSISPYEDSSNRLSKRRKTAEI
jgi:hypothetical protein